MNSILSDLDSIVSDEPIRKPIDGEEIVINGDEYKVVNTKISFERNGDITYYDFIVLLSNKIEYKPTSEKMDYEGYKKTFQDKYKKQDPYKYNKLKIILDKFANRIETS